MLDSSEDDVIIPVENNSRSRTSLDRADRIEMEWSKEIEGQMNEWRCESQIQQQRHRRCAIYKRIFHYGMSIPSIIIPVSMSFVSQFYGEEHIYSDYATSFGFLTVGIINGLNVFLNYGVQYQKHFDAEARYEELITEIDGMLIKKKKYREPADVSLERIKNKYNTLNKYSIDLVC